ncbi:hypothetical protein [Cellulomonas sp. GbtcB1]|uniref:hypothetical protein n=1 Tax=Cellulomonas sp. GbtcB1 TaxID=2824746 RepID=UPI001C310EF6|nr:hypothetical protein [Cellulomonas sp. GbtcB1]
MTLMDVASESVAALVGAAIATIAAIAAHRSKDRAAGRRSAADAICPRLQDLLQLVRKWDRDAAVVRWFEATEGALNAIEAESHRLPEGWGHLRRSIRAAIGEATGTFAFADRGAHDLTAELPERCPTWADNAEEYLTYALKSVRTWRDLAPSSRRSPELVDFDTWLHRRAQTPGVLSLIA